MFGYADIIFIEIFPVFNLKIFDIGCDVFQIAFT